MWNIDQKGFSLIELMVGLTIGLFGMLIVTQVLIVSNSYRLTTVAAGEAQSIGNLGLYTIEREVRQGGFGLVSQNVLNCTMNGYDNDRGASFTGTLMPVNISDTASPDGVSDTLEVAYATGNSRMSRVLLSQTYAGGDNDLVLQNRFGFTVGSLFLLAEVGKTCTLGQITALPTVDPSNITHASTARFNKSGGIGVSYSANVGELYDLGSGFAFNAYSVNANHELVQDSLLTGQTLVIADNVLAFKAEYGSDTNNDGTVDTWNRTPPADATAWQSVTNIRMGVAVKSPKRERAVVSGDVTLWPGGPVIPVAGEDRYYRYRVYSSIVPLRNIIWRAE